MPVARDLASTTSGCLLISLQIRQMMHFSLRICPTLHLSQPGCMQHAYLRLKSLGVIAEL